MRLTERVIVGVVVDTSLADARCQCKRVFDSFRLRFASLRTEVDLVIRIIAPPRTDFASQAEIVCQVDRILRRRDVLRADVPCVAAEIILVVEPADLRPIAVGVKYAELQAITSLAEKGEAEQRRDDVLCH